MFEAYKIGVTLSVANLVSPQLALLMKEFEKLDLLAEGLTKTLKAISVDSTGLRKLATATNATSRAFEKANIAAGAYQARLAAIHQMGGLAAASAQGVRGWPAGTAGWGGPAPPGGGVPAGGGRLPPPRGGGGAGGGHGSYGGFHGGNIHMGPGGIGMGTVGMAAGDWFVPLAVSGAIGWGGKALYESAKDLNTEQNKFRLFGMTGAQNQEAFDFAKNNPIYGTTQVDRLAAMREAQGVFRESGLSGSAALAGSKIAGPLLAKLDFLDSSLDDESKARMHTSNLSMLRYVESSGGLKSVADFNRIADFGYKLNVSSGGTVNWEQLRQFKARAGAAGFHLTDDAMARLEPVIAEMKGGAVGFGLSTSFNRLTGATRVPNQIAHELVDQGIWDPSAILWNKAGGIKQFTTPGGPLSKDKIELLSSNPELFYERFIKPMYDKMKLDSAEIARQNVMIFGTTGGRNMTLIDNQLNNIHASVSALAKTMGIDAAGKVAAKSLSGQEQEFIAAWKDFKTNFGTAVLPAFTGLLKGASSILRQTQDAHSPLAYSTGWAFINEAWKMVSGGFSDNTSYDSKFVSPGRYGSGNNGPGHVYLDGRKVGEVVSKHQAKAFSMPQTGTGYFDSLQTPMPAGGL